MIHFIDYSNYPYGHVDYYNQLATLNIKPMFSINWEPLVKKDKIFLITKYSDKQYIESWYTAWKVL
jgi:hypothetical protein